MARNVPGPKQSKTRCCLSRTLILPSQLPNIRQVVCSAGVKFARVKSEHEQKDHKFCGNKKTKECYLCLHAKEYKIKITTIVNIHRPRSCSSSNTSKKQSKSAPLELLIYPHFTSCSYSHVSKAKHRALRGTRASKLCCAHCTSSRLVKT